jgi:excinuclease UvrABC ATPase subunit
LRQNQRQLNDTFPPFIRHRLPHYGNPEVDDIENLSVAIIIDQKRIGGNARSTVGTASDIYTLLRLLFSRVGEPFVGYSNVSRIILPGCVRHATGWVLPAPLISTN